MIASIRPSSRSSISAFSELLGHARQHPERRSGAGPSCCTCCIWSRKSSSVNCPLRSFSSAFAASLLVEGRLGLLDEREHVAHAEDAARHAVGVERLEVVELLAGAGEEDRLADHLLHRQRRATARVAVDLGEDHAGRGRPPRRTPRRRSPPPDRSSRRRRAACRAAATASRIAAQLVHELGVDLQTTGGVDDHDVAPEARRLLERAARDR